jgi:hypothetical protein
MVFNYRFCNHHGKSSLHVGVYFSIVADVKTFTVSIAIVNLILKFSFACEIALTFRK